MALLAPGQGAFAAIKQLLIELEPIIGAEGVDRVRAEAKEALTATGLPKEYLALLGKGLDRPL